MTEHSSEDTPPEPSTLERLIARSRSLKSELVEFAQSPRFAKSLRPLFRSAVGPGGQLQEQDIISVLDRFVLQHVLQDGQTVVERFVTHHRPPLPADERELLLGWRNVVEGVLEVRRIHDDSLEVLNLIDDLPYRVYSNAGPQVFDGITAGTFLVGRIVPLPEDAWLVSGALAAFPAEAGPDVARVAVEAAVADPALFHRNPLLLERTWRAQAEQRASFISHFGSELVVLTPDEAAAGLQRLGLAGLPRDLLDADTVGLLFDEREGLLLFRDLERLEELFAEPSLARDPTYAAQLRSHLSDTTASPLALRRLVERHPENADAVFRAVLGKPRFSWERDGEALLRLRKKAFYDREPRPAVRPVLGDRLTELLESAN